MALAGGPAITKIRNIMIELGERFIFSSVMID